MFALAALWCAFAAAAHARPQSGAAPSAPADTSARSTADSNTTAVAPTGSATVSNSAVPAACAADAKSNMPLPDLKAVGPNGQPVKGAKITLAPGSEEAYTIGRCFMTASTAGAEMDCVKAIELYRGQVIPRIELAKFPQNKAKYLGMAYFSIAECQAQQGRYIDAEKSLRDALAQVANSPGKDDEQYPQTLNALSIVQQRENHRKDAEATGAQTAVLYEGRINDYKKVLAKTSGEVAANVREAMQSQQRSRADALADLAVMYSRDGSDNGMEQAAKTIELAYQDTVAGATPNDQVKIFVDWGARFAELSGNASDAAKGSARGDTTVAKPATSAPSQPQ